jgi:ribosome recycling factor
LKDLEKDKEISEDDQRRSEEQIQKLTDTYVGNIEAIYQVKETDLLSI